MSRFKTLICFLGAAKWCPKWYLTVSYNTKKMFVLTQSGASPATAWKIRQTRGGRGDSSRGDSSSYAGCILSTVWLHPEHVRPISPSQPLCCLLLAHCEHPRNMGGQGLWDVGDIDLLFRVLDAPQSFWDALFPPLSPDHCFLLFFLATVTVCQQMWLSSPGSKSGEDVLSRTFEVGFRNF